MVRKTEILLLLVITIISISSIYQMYLDNQKIEFLENELVVKSLEYEWLHEVTDSLVNGFGDNFDEQIKSIAEYKQKYPDI